MNGDLNLKRVLKNPDVRRIEIMMSAEKLFKAKGYTKTPVEAIIKSAGIAKGTFYYYFKTKQDILKALVDYIAEQMEIHYKSILAIPNLSALEKFRLMIRGQEKKSIISSSVIKIIHKPENRELQEELNIQGVKIIAPLIAQVLQKGYEEGIFKNKVSIESIQLMLAGSLFVLDSGLFKWKPEQRASFLNSSQKLLELIVGAKSGAFAFISEKDS